MALQAHGPNLDRPVGLRRMGVVAACAPEPALALAGAAAQCQLFTLADGLYALRLAHIGDENTLQPGSSLKVEPALARIENAHFAFQVTLLADAVPLGLRELGRIDNRARSRILQMSFNRSVTALTGNGLQGRLGEAVAASGYEVSAAGVTEYAAFGNWVGEVQHLLGLIPGRQIPGARLAIKRDWRLEQVVADAYQVA